MLVGYPAKGKRQETMRQAHPNPYAMAHRMTQSEIRLHYCDNPNCGATTDDRHQEPERCEWCGRPTLTCTQGERWTDRPTN